MSRYSFCQLPFMVKFANKWTDCLMVTNYRRLCTPATNALKVRTRKWIEIKKIIELPALPLHDQNTEITYCYHTNIRWEIYYFKYKIVVSSDSLVVRSTHCHTEVCKVHFHGKRQWLFQARCAFDEHIYYYRFSVLQLACCHYTYIPSKKLRVSLHYLLHAHCS